MSFIACLSTDGDDVQANAPLDSALVSESATNEPGEETGVYV